MKLRLLLILFVLNAVWGAKRTRKEFDSTDLNASDSSKYPSVPWNVFDEFAPNILASIFHQVWTRDPLQMAKVTIISKEAMHRISQFDYGPFSMIGSTNKPVGSHQFHKYLSMRSTFKRELRILKCSLKLVTLESFALNEYVNLEQLTVVDAEDVLLEKNATGVFNFWIGLEKLLSKQPIKKLQVLDSSGAGVLHHSILGFLMPVSQNRFENIQKVVRSSKVDINDPDSQGNFEPLY